MKYTLKWSGRDDSDKVQAAFAYCKKQIPICKDVCTFVTYDECRALIEAGELEEFTKYWSVAPGQVAMVAHSGYVNEYAKSWEDLSNCYQDFLTGYEACEKLLKLQLDWDEAIKLNAQYNDDNKVKIRHVTMDLSQFADKNGYIESEVFSCLLVDFPELTNYTRKSTKRRTILKLAVKTTAIGITGLTNAIELYYKARKIA